MIIKVGVALVDFVVVVGKEEVYAAGVDVDLRSKLLRGDRRALNVPSWSP